MKSLTSAVFPAVNDFRGRDCRALVAGPRASAGTRRELSPTSGPSCARAIICGTSWLRYPGARTRTSPGQLHDYLNSGRAVEQEPEHAAVVGLFQGRLEKSE